MARKLSLDSKAIKTFMFHHVEKVILGIAGVLLLAFLWIGFSTKPKASQTPEQLKQLAMDADRYVETGDSWETIKDYRKGDDQSDVRIKNAATNVLKADKYSPVQLAKKEKQARLRTDPELYKADEIDVLARAFKATLFVKPQNPNVELESLESVAASGNVGNAGSRRGGKGAGVGAIGGGDDQDMDTRGGTDDSKAEDKKAKDKILPFGDQFLQVHRLELPGIRPDMASGLGGMTPAPFSIVEVVGVVPFEDVWNKYEKIFVDAREYSAVRDRPHHVFLEVQRKMVDQPDDQWVTINKLSDRENDPFGGVHSPELVDPDYFDSALTQPLPPFAYTSYSDLVTHPKAPLRNMRPASLFTKQEVVKSRFDPNAAFNSKEDSEEAESTADPESNIFNLFGSSTYLYDLAQSAAKPKAPFKLIRFFDYNPPKAGEFHYRVRVWFEDPNNPPSTPIAATAGGDFGGGGVGAPGGSGKAGGVGAPGGAGKAGGAGAPGGVGGAGLPGGAGGRQGGVGAPGGAGKAGGLAGAGAPTGGIGSPGGRDQDEDVGGVGAPGGAGKAGGGGVGGGGSGGGGYFAVDRKALSSEVRARLNDQESESYKGSLPDPLLEHAVASEWSNPTNPVSVGGLEKAPVAEVYAGYVARDRKKKIDATMEVSRSEPVANVVVNAVVDGLYTFVPFKRNVFRGDYLNFTSDMVHLMHPVTMGVLKKENAELRSDALVVDIMGGNEINLREIGANDVQPNALEGFEPEDSMGDVIPGGILIMDANGDLKVEDVSSDYGRYRGSLFLPDELREFGKTKSSRKEEDEEDKGGGSGKGGK